MATPWEPELRWPCEAERRQAFYDRLLVLLWARGGALPKEPPGQRQRRQQAIANKLHELRDLLREAPEAHMVTFPGPPHDSTVEGIYWRRASARATGEPEAQPQTLLQAVQSLEERFNRGLPPIFENVSPHISHRSADPQAALLYGELMDMFWRWSGGRNLHSLAALAVRIALDQREPRRGKGQRDALVETLRKQNARKVARRQKSGT